MHNKHKGFSLLEMTISLTIISFIIGVVLTGQNMAKRAELNQVISDISTITSAIKQFKTKYSSAIPGDFINAVVTFGSSTTNGNGDGDLDTGTPNEELFFWQHLQLEGLINGSYTGTNAMETEQKYGFYFAHKAAAGRLNIQVSKAGAYGLFTTKEAADFDTKYDDGSPTITTTSTISAADGTGETATNCVLTATSYNTANLSGAPCVIYFYLE